MPEPRRQHIRLPFERSVVRANKLNISLRHAQELARKRELFVWKRGAYKPISMNEVEPLLKAYLQKTKKSPKLSQVINNHHYPLRSKMHWRYAAAKAANLTMGTIQEDIDQLSNVILQVGESKENVHFDSINEIRKSIPRLVSLSQKSEALAELKLKQLDVRRKYFEHAGKGMDIRNILDEIEMSRTKWDAIRRKAARMANNRKMLYSDVAAWKKYYKKSIELNKDLQFRLKNMERKGKMGDPISYRASKARFLRAAIDFYRNRVDELTHEYKVYSLYGLLLKGRTIDELKNLLEQSRKEVGNAESKLREVFD